MGRADILEDLAEMGKVLRDMKNNRIEHWQSQWHATSTLLASGSIAIAEFEIGEVE
jgi:hypothetical protein